MKVELKECERFLERWKDILRLRDWDITIHLVEQEWRKTGDIKIDSDDKKAILMLNNFNPKQDNLEALIIHELLHLKLWDMDQMIEELVYATFGQDENDPKFQFAYNKFMHVLEPTTEDLAKAFLTLGGEDKNISFGRVRKQVEEELRNNVKP